MMGIKRVLVIDDDESVRKAFSLALEDEGLEVNSADCGENGVKEQSEKGYDLIFLDLKMPGINGVETLKQIREIDSDVPVYIVTSFHKEFLEQLQEVKEQNLKFQLLRKPIGMDDILEVTTMALA